MCTRSKYKIFITFSPLAASRALGAFYFHLANDKLMETMENEILCPVAFRSTCSVFFRLFFFYFHLALFVCGDKTIVGFHSVFFPPLFHFVTFFNGKFYTRLTSCTHQVLRKNKLNFRRLISVTYSVRAVFPQL